MYPLKALLVGCTDVVLPGLRRELSNLSVVIEGEYADSRSCSSHILARPDKGRLVLFQASSVADTAQLEGLNDAASGMPILALVDPETDPSLMIRAMRGGAAQVVRVPLQLEDFRGAIHRIAVQFGYPHGQCRTIAVLGASEGCGASTIALNLASEIGRLKNTPCILAEEAISFGRLAHYLNIEPPLTMADLLRDIELMDAERVRGSLTRVEENLDVLVGSYRSISPLKPTGEHVLKLFGFLKQLTDAVVIDGRSTYVEGAFDLVTQSQQIVVVAKPTVPSIHNLMTLLAHLGQKECVAQMFIAINQFDATTEVFSPRRLSEVLSVPKVYTVSADAAAMSLADNYGQTLRKAAPHSRTLSDVTHLAKAVLGLPADPEPGVWSIGSAINRITHLFHHTQT